MQGSAMVSLTGSTAGQTITTQRNAAQVEEHQIPEQTVAPMQQVKPVQTSVNNNRIINPRDINFHNGGSSNQNGGYNNTMNTASPNKKVTNNGESKNYTNEKVERIQVTIPNPLLMPSANVQIQFQQEIVRNVIQRVDDIFHLKQIVDIKNNKLKDKALANSD